MRRMYRLDLPRLSVVGVGGAGTNAINRMIDAGVRNVDFVTLDCDKQSQQRSHAAIALTLGDGCGAKGCADFGRKAMLHAQEDLLEALEQTEMVFITAGMGGGTGSGAAPVVAQLAREAGALTIGVVTMPFRFEGQAQYDIAQAGVDALRPHVDTLIVIPNDRLLSFYDIQLLPMAFTLADEMLCDAVQGIADMILQPSLINLDFADVRAIMQGGGASLITTGNGEGCERATIAAENALRSDLLGLTIDGAHAVIMHVCASNDVSLHEVNQAATLIRQRLAGDAQIIFGLSLDEMLQDRMQITLVATGFDDYRQRSAWQDLLARTEGRHQTGRDLIEAPQIPERRQSDVATAVDDQSAHSVRRWRIPRFASV